MPSPGGQADLEGSLQAVSPGQQAGIISGRPGGGLAGTQIQVYQAHLVHGQLLEAGQQGSLQAYQEWHGGRQVVLPIPSSMHVTM